jgi:6-pyruvoyltetrahydropterin/6-carboxytetrahydropterin synthase
MAGEAMSLKITLNRVYEFSSAHRLNSPELDEKENEEIYDKCNNVNGHGHDYRLEVSIKGIPEEKTGMIIPLDEFDNSVRGVIGKLDYKHLDKEVDFFKTNLSSGEIIIQYIWQELDEIFPGEMLYHLKLWETNNNYFEYGRDYS